MRVQMNERADTLKNNKDWRVTIQRPPEYVAYRTQIISMLEKFQEI